MCPFFPSDPAFLRLHVFICSVLFLEAGCGLQRGAAAVSPAAGSTNTRSQLETRAVLPVHPAGLLPERPAPPQR